MGRPPLLLHLWSLGVEEQFYLFWPWVVLLVLRFTRRPTRALCWLAGLGAVVSGLLMALLFVPGHDPSDVYYDTFTHSGGLMLGAALAAGVRDRRYVPAGLRKKAGAGATADLSAPVVPKPVPARARRWETGVGVVALAGIAVLIAQMTDQGTFTYRGGIFLASALTAVAIWALLRRGPFARALSVRPLRYLGTRSYSLYLWHWPVICLTRPNLDLPLSGAPLLVLRLGLMAGLAEGSYRFVEQPFRTGHAQAAFWALRSVAKRAVAGSAGLAGATVVALLVLVNPPALPAALAQGSTPAARVRLIPAGQAGSGGSGGPSPTTGGAQPTRAQVVSATSSPTSQSPASGPGGPASPSSTPASTAQATTAPSLTAPARTALSRSAPSSTARVITVPTSTAPLVTRPPGAPSSAPLPSSVPPSTAPAQAAGKLGHSVLAIGDSVLLAAASAIDTRLHGDITVDAVVGRQVWTGVARLEQYRDAGDLVGLKAIVIALGSNGPMTPSDVAQLRALARGVPLLVFINVRVDRPWQSETNASLEDVAGQPGVRVVNWYAASAAPGLLWPDGVHPDPAGATVYAELVASALAPSATSPPRHPLPRSSLVP
jgi:peptidoglycan/LPS O-acetylase OafA/YrhL